MQNPKTIALCGVGRMGIIRADALAEIEDIKISYIIDPISISQRDSLAQKHKALPANYLHEVIDKVDAVILCTPTIFHGADIKLCIEKKKPVFSEKPLAFTKKEIWECYELAKKEKVPIFTAYNRRAAKPFRELKKEIKPEDIHRITFIFRDNPMPPVELLKTLGDIYEDVSCHDLDLALWYLQEKPTKVFAKSFASFNDQGVIDCAAAILEFSNQRAVLCDWSRKSTTMYDERVEIFSKDRTLTADIKKPDGKNGYSFREAYWDAYFDELVQFKTIIDDYYATGNFQIERPTEYCLWVVDIVNALQRSAISGKEEFVCPSGSIPLGILAQQFWSDSYNDVISSHLWDYFTVQTIQDCTKTDNFNTFYIAEKTLFKKVLSLLSEKKSILLEPNSDTINTLKEYTEVTRLARENNAKLIFNFTRRYEKKFIEIKKYIQNQIGDLKVVIADENTIENIDIAVFLSSPFVSAELEIDKAASDARYKFTKSDGSILSFTFKPKNSKVTSITVNDREFYSEGKEEANERLNARIASLTTFYKAVKFHINIEPDISHYWCYFLKDKSIL